MQLLADIAPDFSLEFPQDLNLLQGLYFFFLVLGPQLLPASVDNLNNHVQDAHKRGHNSQVEASHSYVDHGGLAVVVEVVEQDEYFYGDDADVVDEPDDDLHLALVGTRNYQVKLEG